MKSAKKQEFMNDPANETVTDDSSISNISSTTPSQEEQNTSTKWNKALFIETVEIIDRFAQCNHKNLTTEKTITFLDEIYKYSLKKGKLDPQFANWLLSKGLTEE